ncbi:nucleotidyltransferase domain-containing protein [Candidatus Woesearchaeota archaeon]|nr:nucleotidyltransferase domain-containing protein [Candidatus Woesearchaeota archaeon]
MAEKIKRLIFRNPERWAHIREIARNAKVSHEAARKHLMILKKNGIVQEKREGNMIQYRANIGNEKYRIEKMLSNLRAIMESGIAEFLHEFYSPKAIVLFGSYARGEDLSESDIDVGIVTSSKKRPDLRKFEMALSKKIELSLFTRKEVSDEFFTNIINGIVLKGALKNE